MFSRRTDASKVDTRQIYLCEATSGLGHLIAQAADGGGVELVAGEEELGERRGTCELWDEDGEL